MKHFYSRALLGLAALALVAAGFFFSSKNSESNVSTLSYYSDNDRIDGELIVMLKEGVNVNDFVSSYDNIGLSVKEDVFKDYNIWLLQYNVARSQPGDALLSVMRSPQVSIVQFNHTINQRATPDDSLFANQWDMNNTGQNGGLVDADIDAPEAWNISTGGVTAQGDTIVSCVVDGGFYLTNTDINFWKNWREIPGNGIDDDSNGYVDDVNGWNAVNNNGTVGTDMHGTHVSGTIGAKGNNHRGVAGINWNVKVMGVVGSTSQEAVAIRAYGYVLKQRKLYNQTNGQKGAFVVSTNSSFGVDNGQPANYPLWCAFYDSLGKAGVLSAGAGPNNSVNIDVVGDIPTACPSNWLIAVTNTTNRDNRYKTVNSGAGWGPINMDIGAPGTNILSTNSATGYGNLTGTSMATPHVAGTIALMYAAADPSFITLAKTKPDSVALLFKQFLLSSVDTLPGWADTVLSRGRLNLYKTLSKVSTLTSVNPNPVKIVDYRLAQNFPNPFNPSTTIRYSIPKGEFVKVKIFDITGKEVSTLVNEQKPAGTYNLQFNGAELSSGIYFYTIKAGSFTETKQMVLIK